MSHNTTQSKKPRIQELGGDTLLKVSAVQILLAVIAPFFFAMAYFVFAAMDLYAVAILMLILLYALQHPRANQRLLRIEVNLILCIWASALILTNTYPALLIYCIIIHIGSWIIPLMTSYFPHRSHGDDEYALTKRFRGKLFALLSLEHLYHLEHHMYPSVPHQNWPKLARKLDPHLDAKKVEPIVFLK